MRLLVLCFMCLVSVLIKAPHAVAKGTVSSPPKVLVTIKPIHSLVAGIMEGVGEPELLMEADSSAHTHHLKPSEASKLHKAQVIIWVGPIYEAALKKSLDAVKNSVQLITVTGLKGVHLLPSRAFHRAVDGGCVVDLHSCHNSHADQEDHHEIPGKDGHLWLAAPNAKIIVKAIAQELAQLDQRNAPRYLANSQKIIKKLNELHADLVSEMKSAKGAKYLTFHDFTQYFDIAYGTQCIGAVRINPEVEPSAADLQVVRHQAKEGARAIFSEPQFDTKSVRTIAEDTGLNYAQLDALGFGLDKGPNLYFEMMRRLAYEMRKAFTEEECILPLVCKR
ncbi:zinc ABC transporter substrate-binding protein [Candidatus Odyssella thessalonicensis]|uniref:zinc ABC transporter substrate-binding protein n=1 Tax=Candidatus Odyssella thessalonicensis TaxID=84647 RepID=UPI000225B924|nr:zinc ABC transporter substrate-binding protein [Candidatus Odyssella thessalonicensis]